MHEGDCTATELALMVAIVALALLAALFGWL